VTDPGTFSRRPHTRTQSYQKEYAEHITYTGHNSVSSSSSVVINSTDVASAECIRHSSECAANYETAAAAVLYLLALKALLISGVGPAGRSFTCLICDVIQSR